MIEINFIGLSFSDLFLLCKGSDESDEVDLREEEDPELEAILKRMESKEEPAEQVTKVPASFSEKKPEKKIMPSRSITQEENEDEEDETPTPYMNRRIIPEVISHGEQETQEQVEDNLAKNDNKENITTEKTFKESKTELKTINTRNFKETEAKSKDFSEEENIVETKSTTRENKFDQEETDVQLETPIRKKTARKNINSHLLGNEDKSEDKKAIQEEDLEKNSKEYKKVEINEKPNKKQDFEKNLQETEEASEIIPTLSDEHVQRNTKEAVQIDQKQSINENEKKDNTPKKGKKKEETKEIMQQEEKKVPEDVVETNEEKLLKPSKRKKKDKKQKIKEEKIDLQSSKKENEQTDLHQANVANAKKDEVQSEQNKTEDKTGKTGKKSKNKKNKKQDQNLIEASNSEKNKEQETPKVEEKKIETKQEMKSTTKEVSKSLNKNELSFDFDVETQPDQTKKNTNSLQQDTKEEKPNKKQGKKKGSRANKESGEAQIFNETSSKIFALRSIGFCFTLFCYEIFKKKELSFKNRFKKEAIDSFMQSIKLIVSRVDSAFNNSSFPENNFPKKIDTSISFDESSASPLTKITFILHFAMVFFKEEKYDGNEEFLGDYYEIVNLFITLLEEIFDVKIISRDDLQKIIKQ